MIHSFAFDALFAFLISMQNFGIVISLIIFVNSFILLLLRYDSFHQSIQSFILWRQMNNSNRLPDLKIINLNRKSWHWFWRYLVIMCVTYQTYHKAMMAAELNNSRYQVDILRLLFNNFMCGKFWLFARQRFVLASFVQMRHEHRPNLLRWMNHRHCNDHIFWLLLLLKLMPVASSFGTDQFSLLM